MEEDNISSRRIEELGYKPQRENIYNKLLPYAKELDNESTKLFTDIKTNLVKAVLAREMRPGCALWTSRLNKYVKIYGMKFSKEDHIALIKLFYELIIIPDLEPTRINKCATTLVQLLKKKYLLTRDDLQLDWRPLYDLCKRVIEKSKTDIGMYRYFATFEQTIFNLVKASKIYFPASATQEILDEFRPLFCPFTTTEMGISIQYLEMFLPVTVSPAEADISYGLWFEEFMTMWETCHGAYKWENHMMWLVASLGRFQMGHLNWEPYIPTMFVRFMRTLQMPVYYKQKQLGKPHKIDISAISMWIAYTLNGDNNSAFAHFEKFMQTLESYYHSANIGRWTPKIRELLRKLSYNFVQRVHSERHKKPSWDFQCPDHFKLTDADIDRFVNIMKPCLEQAIFARLGFQDTSLALQYLASLRPNIIVPITLDKLYTSMDSLTEPLKLISSMMSVIAVGRYMVQGQRNNYPEGPTHVIPLLMALLPGIDPNDLKKTYVTFNFIVHFINMVPIINSSDASNYHKLSEEEHIICEATAGFEDFVLQLFDRLSTWMESSSLEFVRQEQNTNMGTNNKSRAETIAEGALASVISVVLTQCAPSIFTNALKKIYNFVISRVMEVMISGKMVAVTVHCFSRVNPKETLKLFLPYLCDSIEQHLQECPNIEQEEHVDAELLYHLLILSELVAARTELLPYMDRLVKILDRTLHMADVNASLFATKMLENIISTLTCVLPDEIRSCDQDYSSPVQDFLPIREWGKPQDMKELNISWHVPEEQHITQVQMLVKKYLVPELEKLDKVSSGVLTLSRQELQQTLKIVVSSLACQSVLPMWDEEPIHLFESVLDPWAFHLIVGPKLFVTLPNGANVRKTVVDTLHKLQAKLLEIDEGDTRSIQIIVNIYNIVLFNKIRGQDFEFHWKNFHMAKKLLEDRLHQNKLHLRHVIIDRVMLQQEFRNESRNCSFTKTHQQVLLDLFELSVSRYSEVRLAAQTKLFSVISYFPYSYTILTPKITEVLRMDSQLNHERFKGCLNILVGPKGSPIIARHDWQFIRQLWPLIVKSQPSEKPSIINLINSIQDSVHKFFPTIAIKLIIPDSSLAAAKRLAVNFPVVDLSACQHLEANGAELLKVKSQERRVAYDTTLDELLDACETGKLNWRYYVMALTFIKDLVHFDVKYNSRVVRFFLNATTNEAINIRKIALRVMVYIVVQNKPKFQKVTVDPLKFSGSPVNNFYPGVRPDNEWLLYNRQTLPKTESAWEELRYVHDSYTGYYGWPKELKLYEPPSKQPTAAKRMDNLNEVEKEIYGFFTDSNNVEQLIKYLSMEEKKGQDQFNIYRFLLFKNLFKIFEDELLPMFLPHIKRLVEDKHESSQRCAAELTGAIIRGSKHWPFAKIENLWSNFIPILQTVITNISIETVCDWSLCITMALESRDPNQNHWLLEFLMDDPVKEQTSFVAASRLQLLYIALNQQPWRNAMLSRKLLEYLKEHLSHPFQNIREKLSNCLSLVFCTDFAMPNGTLCRGPVAREFFMEVFPKLHVLYCDSLSKIDKESRNDVEGACRDLGQVTISSDEEKENALRLYKTVLKYIALSIVRGSFHIDPEYYTLLPLACVLQNYDKDDEVVTITTNLLTVLAQSSALPKYIPNCLASIKTVVACPFWSARAVITEFASAFVFYNMATISTNEKWVNEVLNIVLELMEDTQPEVRVGAAQILSGLLHCQFIRNPNELLVQLKLKAKTKLKRKTTENGSSVNNIRIRHAGVLGLCAFISSRPYDVPDYLQDVFKQLGPHLSDPQPIPATIRKTLGDFKRTHHDNWEVHKMKFTEDELALLSDLTVPPSYYA